MNAAPSYEESIAQIAEMLSKEKPKEYLDRALENNDLGLLNRICDEIDYRSLTSKLQTCLAECNDAFDELTIESEAYVRIMQEALKSEVVDLEEDVLNSINTKPLRKWANSFKDQLYNYIFSEDPHCLIKVNDSIVKAIGESTFNTLCKQFGQFKVQHTLWNAFYSATVHLYFNNEMRIASPNYDAIRADLLNPFKPTQDDFCMTTLRFNGAVDFYMSILKLSLYEKKFDTLEKLKQSRSGQKKKYNAIASLIEMSNLVYDYIKTKLQDDRPNFKHLKAEFKRIVTAMNNAIEESREHTNLFKKGSDTPTNTMIALDKINKETLSKPISANAIKALLLNPRCAGKIKALILKPTDANKIKVLRALPEEPEATGVAQRAEEFSVKASLNPQDSDKENINPEIKQGAYVFAGPTGNLPGKKASPAEGSMLQIR